MALPWQHRAAKNDSPLVQVHRLSGYRSALEKLLADLDEFEATDFLHHKTLSSLVRSIADVLDSVPIDVLLGFLTTQDMDPLSQTWLLSCLKKIRRYGRVASSLCRIASRNSMLRNTRVQAVTFVDNLQSNTSSLEENIMDIDQYLKRFQYEGKTVQMGTLPDWLRHLAQTSTTTYKQHVRDILKHAKVHAEIQLLAYYESEHNTGIRPRILASSKNACALCNSLIAIHGQHSVPKSHGRLYRGWRLPAAHQKAALQDDLNILLESSISETLARLMSLSKRPRIEFDNESSIFSFSLSASTPTDSSTSATSEHHNNTAAVVGGEAGPDVAINQSDQSHTANRSPTEHASTGEKREEDEDDIEGYDGARPSKHTDGRPNSPGPHGRALTEGYTTSPVRQPADVRLKHGQPMLFSPGQCGNSCFRSRRTELLIDDESSRFSIELLRTAEAEAVLSDETKPKADVKAMSSGIDVLLSKCAKGEVYISHGEEVIRICARPG